MDVECERCSIRSWRVGDEAALARRANGRAVWLNLRDRFPHPYTLGDAEAWVRFAGAQPSTTWSQVWSTSNPAASALRARSRSSSDDACLIWKPNRNARMRAP